MKITKFFTSLFLILSPFYIHSNALAQSAFVEVDAFGGFVCGIREEGTAECRTTGIFSSPIPEGLPPVVDIAAGLATVCVLLESGDLSCSGSGAFGLNDTPTEGAPYQSVALSQAHACAINRDNNIECWGLDTNGRLDAPAGEFTQLSLSSIQQSCALDLDGGVSCWGGNDQGTLDVPGDLPPALKVESGFASSCALLEDGTISCWGREIPDFPGTFTDFDLTADGSIQSGTTSICAIDEAGEITCRFFRYNGVDEPPEELDDMASPSGSGHSNITLAAFRSGCYINSSGEIECFGNIFISNNFDFNAPLPQPTTTGLRALVYSATAAELIWNVPPDTFNVSGHEIQRNGEIAAFTQNLSSFLLTDLIEGEAETFAVRRVGVNGEFGLFSETITVTSVAGEPDFAPTVSNFIPPDRLFEESTLDAFVFCSTVADLFWFSDLPSGEIPDEIDGFEIHRDGQFIAFTENDSFEDPGITEGFVHNYDVIAIDLDEPTRFHGVASATLELQGFDEAFCDL